MSLGTPQVVHSSVMDNQEGATPNPSQQTSGHAAAKLMHAAGKDEALKRAIQEHVSKPSDDDRAAFQFAPDIVAPKRDRAQ